MNQNSKEMGERIKKARKAAKLNQTELASKLNKTMRTVQKYESGEIEPSIAMIHEIAKVLNVNPTELIGYRRPGVDLSSLSDVLAVLYELNKKAGIRFEVDVKRPPRNEVWSCSLKFYGNDKRADLNGDLCLILERFQEERLKLETYWTDQEYFDHWMEEELSYYSSVELTNREVEELSQEERLRRRNELDRQAVEARKKAAEEDGSQK